MGATPRSSSSPWHDLIINDVTLTLDKRPRCNLVIRNTHLPALWDTGSAVSLLARSAVQHLLSPSLRRPCRMSLKSASGHYLTGLECYQLPFTIGDHSDSFTFVVADNLKTKCILGTNFMARFLYFINPLTGHATRYVPPVIPSPLPSDVSQYAHSASTHTISPNTEKLIKLPLPRSHDTYVTVNPDNNLVPGSLVVVTPAVVEPQDSIVYASVCNPTLFPFKIEKGDALCPYSPISDLPVSCDELFCSQVAAVTVPPSTTTPPADLSSVPSALRPKFEALLRKHHALLNDDADDIGHCGVLPQDITLKDPML